MTGAANGSFIRNSSGKNGAAAGYRLTNNAYALILSKFIFYIHLLYIHIVQQ